MIYFDNNATTGAAPEVFEAMRPFLEGEFGNPSSAYSLGSYAKNAIETARENVAELIGAANGEEIFFTSGGTESDNWAIIGALELQSGKDHIITTTVEHEAVRKLCDQLETRGTRITRLEVDSNGALDLDELKRSLDKNTAVVSVMAANNETGILFPVVEIGEIVREHSDAFFHVDGVNAVGKVEIDLRSSEIDLFSLSAHKFHGPKGIGVLYQRSGIEFPRFLIGGGQERGRRAGTEAVHQIAGLGAAAAMVKDMAPMQQVKNLRDRLENEILNSCPNSRLNGTADPSKRLPNTSNISFENTNGEMILAELDALDIFVSTGSACNSFDRRVSPVLQSMNIPFSFAMGAIRFSLGRYNTGDEVEHVLEILPPIVERLNRLAG